MHKPNESGSTQQLTDSDVVINRPVDEECLLGRFLSYLNRWLPAVKQRRTLTRLKKVVIGLMACHGRATITNSIMFRGEEQKDWSADYKLFNRSEIETVVLLRAPLVEGVKELPGDTDIEIALDDMGLPKNGLKIPQARWMHDPLAPKFMKGAVRWGIRMLHAALIIPSANGERPLAITVGFQPIPAVAKPKEEEWDAMSKAEQAAWLGKKKEALLTTKSVELIHHLRKTLDDYGYAHRRLLLVVDGSFTNHHVVGKLPHNTVLIGRFRKDSKLRLPVEGKQGKRIYGDPIPTPEEHRTNMLLPVQVATLWYGGSWREIKFMERSRLYWMGTKSTLARMIIVMPVPYRLPGRKRRGYNKPGYLLTTDLHTPASVLVQAYLNRWQIEVLHRELKDGLGVGQVQAFSFNANETVHTAVAAGYALLTLAGHQMTKGKRDDRFPALPKWRQGKEPNRLTQRDLLSMLRNDLFKAGYFKEAHPTKLPKDWALPRRETIQVA